MKLRVPTFIMVGDTFFDTYHRELYGPLCGPFPASETGARVAEYVRWRRERAERADAMLAKRLAERTRTPE